MIHNLNTYIFDKLKTFSIFYRLVISPSEKTNPSTEDSWKEFEESEKKEVLKDPYIKSKFASPRPLHSKALTGLINSPRYDVRKSINALSYPSEQKVIFILPNFILLLKVPTFGLGQSDHESNN